jgi:hypothetical protein
MKGTIATYCPAALIGLACWVSPVLAAGVGAPTKATTLSPLAIASTQDLDFGTILPGTVVGTVTINPNSGNRSVSGGATAAGGTPQRAEFVAVGRPNVQAVSTLDAGLTLNNGSGGIMSASLTLGGGGPGVFNFPGTGIRNFRVGGTLTVGANQADGVYTGLYNLTVNYF